MTDKEIESTLALHSSMLDELFTRTEDLCDIYNARESLVLTSIGSAGSDFINTSLANRIKAIDPDYALFAGDNNLPSGSSATINTNWSDFQEMIDDQKVYPALGNIDLSFELADPGRPQLDKFPYLPQPQRYYTKVFPNKSTQLFVLNPGYRSLTDDFVEPDGYKIDSDQYVWFVNHIQNSTAKWKIVIYTQDCGGR